MLEKDQIHHFSLEETWVIGRFVHLLFFRLNKGSESSQKFHIVNLLKFLKIEEQLLKVVSIKNNGYGLTSIQSNFSSISD